METTHSKSEWRSSTSIRIVHPQLDPVDISNLLFASADIAQLPGESRVPYGDCRSAGYWCLKHQIEAPAQPNVSFEWAEDFVQLRESQLLQLLDSKYVIYIYIAIFSRVMTVGFELPSTPIIRKLEIPIGLEFYSQ
jgi:hypothetical protein